VAAVTKWSAFPIRQPGQPWQGMDTTGGRLDDGTGKQTKDSVNVTINRVDVLEKRKGFVRGLAERFGTVVCGLHTYVDNCGQEWLLVASDEGVSIRQPFNVPVFENDDSYPLDSFDDADGISTDNWRNTAIYIATSGALQRGTGNSTAPFDAPSYLRWFKAASALAYQVTVQYEFTASVADAQVASVTIKGSGDFTTGRRLQLDLSYAASGTYIARLYKATADGGRVLLGTIDVAGSLSSPTGFLTLGYDRSFVPGSVATFTPVATVIPSGGAAQELRGPAVTELEDRELGQLSGIGCSQWCSLLQVTGGPL
jgi:hypothetical protein